MILPLFIPGLDKRYTSFRLIKKDIAKKINGLSSTNVFLDGSLAMLNVKISSVEVDHCKSKTGKSSYTTYRLVTHTLKTLLSVKRSLNEPGLMPKYLVEISI